MTDRSKQAIREILERYNDKVDLAGIISLYRIFINRTKMSNKLTKKECEELAEIIGRQTGKIRCDGSASFSFIEIWKYLEQKKKEWQEQSIKDFLKPNSGELMKGFKGSGKSADDKVLKSIKH